MSPQASPPVSGLLQQHQEGVRDASAELVALVAAEIRRIASTQARERDAVRDADEQLANLLATVLSDCALDPHDRPPFLTIYARAVRQVVCEYLARDGSPGLAADAGDAVPSREAVLSVDAVLRPLERVNARLVSVVECLYFARLTEDETAGALGSDRAGVQREWMRARAWVIHELATQDGAAPRSDVSIANAVWVDAVLRSAIALPAEDRGEFLEQCHAAAPNLRQEVEHLLRLTADETPGPRAGDLSAAFLWSVLTAAGEVASPVVDAPVEEPGADVPAEHEEPPEINATAEQSTPLEEQPVRLGEWRTVSEQQERGPGRLFLVRRTESEETGSARVLPLRPEPSTIALFNHECRRLAAIDDPAIARLLDYGITSDGQFYVIHAASRGRPLTRYCARHGFDVRRRVRLFVQVCAGIQAAHRSLVAHGALGPPTIVAGDDGKVMILDCGIEPLVSALAGTAAGPAAASVSADIRQTGLLLRALVSPAGSPDRIDADLAAIASCAAEDEGQERYSSIGALRSDLQRWLDRRPVLARGGNFAYRIGRFISRRRVPVALATAAALAAAVLIPSRVAESRRTVQDADRAAAVERVLAGMLDAPPATAATSDLPGAAIYVDRAATLVRTGFASDPTRRSAMLLTIGRAYLELGAYRPSIDVLEEALALARQQHGDDSVQVAGILEPLGQSRHALGRYDEAESSLRTARAIRLLRAGPAHPSTRSATVELALLLRRLGRTAEAEQILRPQTSVLGPAADAGSAPDPLVTRSRAALAGVLRDRGLAGEAESLYRDVLATMGQQRASAERALAQAGLAGVLIAGGETEEPAALLLDGLEALRRLHGPDHPIQLDALRTQARLRLAQSRFVDAHAALAEAQRIHERSVAAFTLGVPAARRLQAELALKEGRMEDAVAASRLALDEFERLSLGDHPLTIEVRAVLGEALAALGRRDEAGPVLGRAVEAADRLLPPSDPRSVRLRAALAEATASRGLR